MSFAIKELEKTVVINNDSSEINNIIKETVQKLLNLENFSFTNDGRRTNNISQDKNEIIEQILFPNFKTFKEFLEKLTTFLSYTDNNKIYDEARIYYTISKTRGGYQAVRIVDKNRVISLYLNLSNGRYSMDTYSFLDVDED